MARRSAELDRGPTAALFRHLNGEELIAADIHGEAAKFADGVFHAREHISVFFHHKTRAIIATGFFIAQDTQEHIAGQRQTFGFGAQERRRHHRHTTFHIQRATTPDHAISQIAGKRRMIPVLIGCADDIDMTIKQQRRRVAFAFDPRHQIWPVGVFGVCARLNAKALAKFGYIRHAGGLVSRRVGRIKADQLLQQFVRPLKNRCSVGHGFSSFFANPPCSCTEKACYSLF